MPARRPRGRGVPKRADDLDGSFQILLYSVAPPLLQRTLMRLAAARTIGGTLS